MIVELVSKELSKKMEKCCKIMVPAELWHFVNINITAQKVFAHQELLSFATGRIDHFVNLWPTRESVFYKPVFFSVV